MSVSSLKGINILLSVTGGIAAYKCPELCRLLMKQGANVQVIMSYCARRFVSPLVMATLTAKPIASNRPEDWKNMEHIELARWCDVILVAPATANVIAKIAHGLCDDMITTVIVASRNRKVVCCPAMNTAMYENIATQKNLQTLTDNNIIIWGPSEGNQACGEFGLGRMIEPDEIVERTCKLFKVHDS